MRNLTRKQTTATAVQNTGNVLELRKFVGINDADYDSQNRAFIIPKDKLKPGGNRVVDQEDYLLEENGLFSSVSEGELNDEYADTQGEPQISEK